MDGAKPKNSMGAMDLLGICGFGFFFAWMLIAYYWLFVEFLPEYPLAERDFAQLFVFVGVAAGYLLFHWLGRFPRFVLTRLPYLAALAVLGALIPVASVATHLTIVIPPLPLLAAVNLLAGVGGAGITVCWLDVCSRLKSERYGRFCGCALLVGSLAFAIVGLMPLLFQPVFCLIYLLVSVGLLHYVGSRAQVEGQPADDEVGKAPWKFAREVEPSLIAFSIVFGLTFVYLFNNGSVFVFVGLLAIIPGAGALAFIALGGRFLNITLMQRILLVVTVLSCLSLPFAAKPVQLACAALVIAAWALFTPVNYGHIVRKSVELGGARAFRIIPIRVFMSALGFVIGWGVASATTAFAGSHASVFTAVRLVTAFVVVLLVMLFFPDSKHHDESADRGQAAVADVARGSVPTPLAAGQSLFEAKCAAVAQLYQLSPRETDILGYLAKGRNAAYIQSKLCISPHTVKSHIYSIYRKVDIHSQQKLMDFVEEYPLEDAAVSEASGGGSQK